MFNLGPMELLVLAIVGIVVIGPEKLPGLARDAAAMLRTLRDLATGARQQLRDELGPEFADLDLRDLNPRTAMQRMVFGEDSDVSSYNPRSLMRDAVLGDSLDSLREADPRRLLRESAAAYKQSYAAPADPSADDRRTDPPRIDVGKVDLGKVDPGTSAAPSAPPRPRPRPRPTSYQDDIT